MLIEIRIPCGIKRNWDLVNGAVLRSRYRHDEDDRIFKFSYQPDSGELLFDIAPTEHKLMIFNHGKKKFDAYIRGICFWDKKIIYLRGHETIEMTLRYSHLSCNHKMKAVQELDKI